MMPTETTWREALRNAANRLERWGWTQGWLATNWQGGVVSFYDGRAVSWCVVGAIYKETFDDDGVMIAQPGTVRAEALLALSKHIKGTGYSYGLGTWNDDPSRTRKQVVAALREAAELAYP